MKFIVHILLVSFLSTSFLFSQESNTVEKDGFSITFSSDWKTNELNGEQIYILGSDKKSGNFMTTMGIEMTKNAKSVEEFSKQHELDLANKREHGDFKIKEKKELLLNNKKAIQYLCTATTAGIPIEVISIVIKHKGKIVIITAIAHWFNDSAKTKDFIQLKETIENILNSIKVL